MATRSYKLYSGTVTSGDNKNLIRIGRKGVITAICVSLSGIAGAAVDANGTLEISFQSVSSFAVNDTPATVICYNTWNAPISGGAWGANSLMAGLSTPVNVNDQIYLHMVNFGTALASGRAYCVLTVNET